jgi:hypothetical protein
MLSYQKIKSGLAQCIGTERYWKNDLLCFRYTDGVKFLHESCEAYWLLIAISSYHRKEPFQLWELKVSKDKSATLSMKEDSDQPNVVEQQIAFTDFPLEEITLYLIDGILLLPSEY